MSELVPTEDIERIVGIERHESRHYARAVSAEQEVYILHSHRCKDSGVDLRRCLFSQALDNGIDLEEWEGAEDQTVRVTINSAHRLVPVRFGLRLSVDGTP